MHHVKCIKVNFAIQVKNFHNFKQDIGLKRFIFCDHIYRVSQKKRNTFDFEYLKDGSTLLIVLLVCYSVLLYNSIEPNFSFLWLSEAKILSFKVEVWFWRFLIYISKLGRVPFHNQMILKEFFTIFCYKRCLIC